MSHDLQKMKHPRMNDILIFKSNWQIVETAHHWCKFVHFSHPTIQSVCWILFNLIRAGKYPIKMEVLLGKWSIFIGDVRSQAMFDYPGVEIWDSRVCYQCTWRTQPSQPIMCYQSQEIGWWYVLKDPERLLSSFPEQHVIANEAVFFLPLFNLSIQMFSTSGSENVSLSSSNFNHQFWGQATAKLPKLWEGKPQQNKENMCSNKPMLNKNAFNCPCLSQLKTRPNSCFSNTLGTCLSLAWPVADLPKAWYFWGKKTIKV